MKGIHENPGYHHEAQGHRQHDTNGKDFQANFPLQNSQALQSGG
jgi:hypothetical protein